MVQNDPNSGVSVPAARDGHDRPIFEAVLKPHRSIGRRGMIVAICIMLGGSAIVTSLMYELGAFPVMGFNGAEMVLAIWLYTMNMRAARASEVIRLSESSLVITRTDPRGRSVSSEYPPYWLSVQLEERPGTLPILVIVGRGVRHVIGADLGEAERRDLAEALRRAFARLRDPRFDNPQTRDVVPEPEPERPDPA